MVEVERPPAAAARLPNPNPNPNPTLTLTQNPTLTLTLGVFAWCIRRHIRSEHNARVERMNRSLKDRSRCMLLDGGCRPEMWGHAIDTAAYLHNRTTSKRNPHTTPYERMWNKKPDVGHLRVFGSVCYPLIQKQFRSAYEHKRTCDVGIFVGYCHGAYLVYVPSKNRVYARRDCWFDENWQTVTCVDGQAKSIYTNPAYTDDPFPSDYLISGAPMLMHRSQLPSPHSDDSFVPTVVATPVPTPLQRNHQWLQSPTMPPSARNSNTPWHLEFCAGTCSALRYHLRSDPHAKCVAFDIRPEQEIMQHIPSEYRARVYYVREDVAHMTYAQLCARLKRIGCSIRDVVHCHGSPPCTTYSEAHHNKNFHRDGHAPLTEQAMLDDKLSANLCALTRQLVDSNPDVCVTLENPVSMWQELPWIQGMAARDNWQLIRRMDHCMMTCGMDDDYFPQKPTTYLTYNCGDQPDIVCNCRCNNRLTTRNARKYHRYLICNRDTKHPDQIVLPNDPLLKARIPLGVFQHFMARHEQQLQLTRQHQEGESVSLPPPKRATYEQVSADQPQSEIDATHNRKIVYTGKLSKKCAHFQGPLRAYT